VPRVACHGPDLPWMHMVSTMGNCISTVCQGMASGQRQFQMPGRSMNVKKEGKVGSNGKGGPKFYYIKSTRGGTKGLKRETASLPKLLQASLLQCSTSSSCSTPLPLHSNLCLPFPHTKFACIRILSFLCIHFSALIFICFDLLVLQRC